jgi:hypothetical protein
METALEFVRRQPEADDVTSFFFRPERPLPFVAGHFLDLTLPTSGAWSGPTGWVDVGIIAPEAPDLAGSHFFVCGPAHVFVSRPSAASTGVKGPRSWRAVGHDRSTEHEAGPAALADIRLLGGYRLRSRTAASR